MRVAQASAIIPAEPEYLTVRNVLRIEPIKYKLHRLLWWMLASTAPQLPQEHAAHPSTNDDVLDEEVY